MKTEGGCIPAWESKIRGQMNSDQLDITKKKKRTHKTTIRLAVQINGSLFVLKNKKGLLGFLFGRVAKKTKKKQRKQNEKKKKKKGVKLSHSSRAVPPLVLRVQETLSCRDVCGRRRAFHLIMSTLQSATA